MKFNYQARNREGEVITGAVEASSRDGALQIIERDGFFVTFLEEVKGSLLYGRKIQLFGRVSLKEVMLFSRQLAIMFKAQVSLVESLEAIGTQTRSQTFRETIYRIVAEVEGGTAFSLALSRYPRMFSSFYISMVKRGEALGTLSEVLLYLADYLEREYELKSKLRSAMIYPVLVVFVAIAVVLLLLLVVVPNIAPILKESGVELPAATKFSLALSDFVRTRWWLIPGVVLAVAFGFFRLITTSQGKKFLGDAFLKTPLLSTFLKTVYLSRFGENLATLIAGGVPLVQALDITREIVGNQQYQRIIVEAKEEVEGGTAISAVLKKYPSEFPPIFTQMVAVGEKSGNLEGTLQSIVEFYRKEVERSVEAFLAIIEPLMIIILGVFVGGLMVSILLPLYQVTGTIQ